MPKKLQLKNNHKLIREIEDALKISHKTLPDNFSKLNKQQRLDIYSYFCSIYSELIKLKSFKLPYDHEINEFLESIKMPLDVKITEAQLKLVRKLENELEIANKPLDIKKSLGEVISNYFNELCQKIKHKKASVDKINELLNLQKERKILPEKSILTLSNHDWYLKMFNILNVG